MLGDDALRERADSLRAQLLQIREQGASPPPPLLSPAAVARRAMGIAATGGAGSRAGHPESWDLLAAVMGHGDAEARELGAHVEDFGERPPSAAG